MFKGVAIALVCAAAAAALAHSAEPPLHDPMRPFQPVAGDGPGAAPVPRFRLTAVLISPARRVAIINGKSYQEGQKVSGAEITHIDAQSVELRDGGDEWVVHLGKTHASAAIVTGESRQ